MTNFGSFGTKMFVEIKIVYKMERIKFQIDFPLIILERKQNLKTLVAKNRNSQEKLNEGNLKSYSKKSIFALENQQLVTKFLVYFTHFHENL